MILDTSFLLDLKDGDEAAFDRAVALYDRGVVQRVAMPSVWELHYGAAYTDSADERRRVRNLLLMYPHADIDQETARRGAELLARADSGAGGANGVDTEDGLIGAVADRLGERVLTDNVDDFDRLGVEYETY
ncbi:PIN domain-containing protein [Haloarcula sp. S1CR25-12]|uniref:PIN domain-containing protein n=1 Tax=Haloarcula saliterrae TaxID=2950534 RepID=A0ABU2F8M6_9EURY|nr:PIN domain-containing protein [Haloarcula sp. S1CR25-12]MDS0258273.1 PIN domain-containing protein [Haloarcula sp. S1CR25-12]